MVLQNFAHLESEVFTILHLEIHDILDDVLDD